MDEHFQIMTTVNEVQRRKSPQTGNPTVTIGKTRKLVGIFTICPLHVGETLHGSTVIVLNELDVHRVMASKQCNFRKGFTSFLQSNTVYRRFLGQLSS